MNSSKLTCMAFDSAEYIEYCIPLEDCQKWAGERILKYGGLQAQKYWGGVRFYKDDELVLIITPQYQNETDCKRVQKEFFGE